MSQTAFVEYRGDGFWAYDVALAIFLKYLIDVAEPRAARPGGEWLARDVEDWRLLAVSDYGFSIGDAWSDSHVAAFVVLASAACDLLAERNVLSAEEIESWPILDNLRISARGATVVCTGRVVELGNAIIELVRGSLAKPPTGTAWYYGTPAGRQTIPIPE